MYMLILRPLNNDLEKEHELVTAPLIVLVDWAGNYDVLHIQLLQLQQNPTSSTS